MSKLHVKNLSVTKGPQTILSRVNLDIPEKDIFAIIGPANAGKTTLLRCINRMIDFFPGYQCGGEIIIEGVNILSLRNTDDLRRRIGMVSPLPVGLPMTIRENVEFAPRMAGMKNKTDLAQTVEECLKYSALWDEVKDRLDTLATKLSGGQQQRLTIARALSHSPDILCLDEFSIAVDPVTTMRIEEVLERLKQRMTIILVTNIVYQARRLAGQTAMMLEGTVVEVRDTVELFTNGGKDRRTNDYIEGRFG